MELGRERALIEQAQTEPAAFGILFDIHYPAVLSYIVKRVGDVATAQDIASETFLKGFKNIRGFTWQDVSISNWFYKIATNEIRQYYRKNKYAPKSLEQLQEKEGFEPLSEQDIHQEIVDAQTKVERQYAFIEAQAMLAALPIKYQEVITLRYVEKKKLREIAVILGKKEGTIKSLLSRGLKNLQKDLVKLEMQPNMFISITASEGQLIARPSETYDE